MTNNKKDIIWDCSIKRENCVVCGVMTDIPISFPVENRKNYVYGVGQLCINCAKAIEESKVKRA